MLFQGSDGGYLWLLSTNVLLQFIVSAVIPLQLAVTNCRQNHLCPEDPRSMQVQDNRGARTRADCA